MEGNDRSLRVAGGKEDGFIRNLIGRRKILTGRPAEIAEETENAYITGTWNPKTGRFEKRWNQFSMSLDW